MNCSLAKWVLIGILLFSACASIPAPPPPPMKLCSLDPETVKLRFDGWQPLYKLTVTHGEDRYTVVALLRQPPTHLLIFVTQDQVILACRLFRADGVPLEDLGPGLPRLFGITT